MTKKTTATNLRSNLFEMLAQVQKGASISIERNGKIIARLVPAVAADWRQAISEKPRLLVAKEKAFEPIEDLFDDL